MSFLPACLPGTVCPSTPGVSDIAKKLGIMATVLIMKPLLSSIEILKIALIASLFDNVIR